MFNFIIMRLFLVLWFLIFTLTVSAQETISLYTGNIPNSKPHSLKETSKFEGIVDTILRFVSHPTLTIYRATDNKTGASVIVIPGGGYHAELITREGKRVAEAFNKKGITAFVLKYRLPNDQTMEDKSIGPLQDLQQAIKLVRENASRWNISPDKIGVMGFSAGGHLAATGGIHFEDVLIQNSKATSLRPDFMLLINPVISFKDEFGHIGSRNNLLGDHPSDEKVNYFSNELNITDQTPPTVLIHANDDTVVPVENSLSFYQGLLKHKVPAALHIYAKGEHGFLKEPAFEEWFGRCIFWMQQMGFTK